MSTKEKTETTLLTFSAGGCVCALPLDSVQEIVPMAELSRPPGLPSCLEGFLVLSGIAVPVLRTDRLLNLSEIPLRLYTPVLLIRSAITQMQRDGTNRALIGLLADETGQIFSVPEEALLPIGEKRVLNDCAVAEVSANGRVVHLLDPNRILLEQERSAVAEFQAIAQQRLTELEQAA